jgi:hypothetical protein
VIGYYVHHVGLGHQQRARAIANYTADEITGLSSLPRPADWPGEWIQLHRDDLAARSATDPTAYGELHWAPANDQGLRARMATIAAWIERSQPRVVVSDVSAEVVAFTRLMGIPVVSFVQPGSRTDPAHRLGYALSEVLIAPWPATLGLDLCDGLQPWASKVRHVGAFSRFDQRPLPRKPVDSRRVLVLQGAGGSAIDQVHLDAAAAHTPDWTWKAIGGAGQPWSEDPWPTICEASVVIVHAGLNALAEVAAARRPAIVIPQIRPHQEQHATAQAIGSAELALVLRRWPEATAWGGLLCRARDLGGQRWKIWSPGTGAVEAARILDHVNTTS